MTDKKLTDGEIIKACNNCLHYEACKGTYYSAKGDEDILYDFDGEMYANSGCEDFQDKDLINRLQAENETLRDVVKQNHLIRNNGKSPLSLIKAEAYKEFAEKSEKEIFIKQDNERKQMLEILKTYRGTRTYSDTERATDNWLRGYGEAVQDILSINDNLLKEMVGENDVNEKAKE